jgi:hypothetical protein
MPRRRLGGHGFGALVAPRFKNGSFWVILGHAMRSAAVSFTGAEVAPSTSSGALRFRHDESAARTKRIRESLVNPREKKLLPADFSPAARCAFVTTDAQRSM